MANFYNPTYNDNYLIFGLNDDMFNATLYQASETYIAIYRIAVFNIVPHDSDISSYIIQMTMHLMN